MFHQLPEDMRRIEVLPDSFRTGLGHDFDDHGPQAAIGMERSFDPWMRTHLLTDVVPRLEGLRARLDAGTASSRRSTACTT